MASKNLHYPLATSLQTSDMQSAMVSNRFVLGIIALGVSFGLSLVLTWNFMAALLTGIITITVSNAALFIDRQQRNSEMRGRRDSLQRRIQELERLKAGVVGEINQLETYCSSLYKESTQLQNQVIENRNQRENFQREVSNFLVERNQLERQNHQLQGEIEELQQTHREINDALVALNTEKRSLDLNCNLSKAEITQLHSQIADLQQQKQDLESSLTLLERLRPQLEEKLYEMRVQIQELEIQETKQSELLGAKTNEKVTLETNLTTLDQKIAEQKIEVEQLQEQVVILQTERDQLQNQVWELLQQVDNVAQPSANEQQLEEDIEPFPFADLIEVTDSPEEIEEHLPEEWHQLLQNMPSHEVEALKAILEQHNSDRILKTIAENQITMPSLLVDDINDRAHTIIGELIIESGAESPFISPEYINHVSTLIAAYDHLKTKQTSSN
ncbi:MAG: tellurite resistance TerB C-terminal domain-containing protein [Calothrix sp. MO_167.B12]|nr:tellurite resistance TerB C-terminal domain-containing protein [Calothrix sp. MO_167.B12]